MRRAAQADGVLARFRDDDGSVDEWPSAGLYCQPRGELALLRSNVVLCVALVAAVVFADTPARAAPPSAKAAAFAEGRRFYDVGEYAEALAAFKRAYLRFDDPTFLYNIAQCHRQLDQKQEALRAYRSYLRNLPNATNRDEVKRLIAALETKIGDEESRAAAPPPRPAAPTSEPAAAPPPVAAEPAPLPLPAAAAPAPTVVARADRRVGTPLYKKWWLWTIVGVAAAGAAAGIAVGVTQSQPTEPAFSPVHWP
jgi:tetratricopeptide (TPR) repeat protein